MEDTSIDESVSQFMAISGSADANQARSYLEMSGNDLQTAISLFLEHQGGGGTSSGGTGSGGASSMGMGDSMMGGGGEGDVRQADPTRTMRLLDYDDGAAAMSRRMGAGLMDHPFLRPHAGMNGMGMGMGGIGVNSDVHAGMNAFADDEDMDGRMDLATSLGVDLAGEGSLRDVMNRAASDPAAAAVAASSTAGLSGSASGNGSAGLDSTQGQGGAVGGSSSARARSLSSMFASPDHLTHRAGGFQGARNVAKDSRRWLLVNLQSDSDFACHALNRDVWRDELVENLVREGYIFWQSLNTQEDGRTYCERYGVTSFPHIGIIDPRTARLMYRKEGWTQENPMTPEAFAEIAADFCSRHSFDRAPVAPRIGNGGSSGANASGNANANGDGAKVEEMSEEEQLQRAIRESMNDNAQNNYDDDESVEYIMEDDDDDDDNDDVDFEDDNASMDDGFQILDSTDIAPTNTSTAAAAAPAEPTFMEQIVAMEVGDEPSAGAARIMIRMPDGKRLVRKFKMDDNVKIIYAFVAQSNDDAKGGKEFVMKAGFPPKDLIDSVDSSIESSGLAGDSITMRWKEDS